MDLDRRRPASPVAHARWLAIVATLGLAAAILGTIAMPGPVAAADPPALSAKPSASPALSSTRVARALAGTATVRTAPVATLAPVLPMDVLIYRKSAMAKQYTKYWCVPAAAQTMVNLVRGTSDRSYATQARYYKGIRAHNLYTYSTKGNDPVGWAWGLRAYARGTTYQARSFANRDDALAEIVAGIDRTRTPVGVTVHNGTHAWVVLGYRAMPDPTDPSRRVILGFYVNGPIGAPKDPWPYAYLTVSQFNQHFSAYHEWQRTVIWEGTWVVISQ